MDRVQLRPGDRAKSHGTHFKSGRAAITKTTDVRSTDNHSLRISLPCGAGRIARGLIEQVERDWAILLPRFVDVLAPNGFSALVEMEAPDTV